MFGVIDIASETQELSTKYQIILVNQFIMGSLDCLVFKEEIEYSGPKS